MSSLKPISPRPSPRNSPRTSPRPLSRPSPRSNPSDSLPGTPRSFISATLTPTITRPATPSSIVISFKKLLDNDHPQYRDAKAVNEDLNKLRRLILTHGIPAKDPSLRPRVWKILLQIGTINGEDYLSLVRKGPSHLREKIRGDSFRTLATDREFKERVRDDMIIRLLDAFAWNNQDNPEQGKLTFGYVQGMNVTAAPFLYIMPSEVEAFYAFSKLMEQCCPLYIAPTLDGVHHGAQLLDQCLAILDPELCDHILSKGLSAKLYAFPSIMTFCACTPPLDQALQLWDFLFAYGVHLNVLCVIAQMMIIRNDVLTSQSPMKFLRPLPSFDAKRVISMTVKLVRDIPAPLYDELTRHPWDTTGMSHFLKSPST